VEVAFLDTLTMVPLWVRQAKESFLEEVTVPGQHGNVSVVEFIPYSFSFQKAKATF
jgi:hypothetical protein